MSKNNRNKNRKKKNQYYSSESHTYQTIYDDKQYQTDEANFSKVDSVDKVDWKGFQRLMLRDICCNTGVIDTESIGDYKLKDVEIALKYPKKHWKTLLGISETLMRISPHYMRLNHLFSNMAVIQWWVDLYGVAPNLSESDITTLKNRYSKLVTQLEKMNIKHEFSKIMRILPYQDIFCGLVIENQNDYFIQPVDYRICRLYQVEDGLYNFTIDLSRIEPRNITAYPDYIQKEIIDYLEHKNNNPNQKNLSTWYLPPSDKQICIKFNSQYTYPFPFMIGLIRDILDMDIYKKLKLQSARTDNYKAIMIKVPIDEKKVDKPLLTPDLLALFAEINRESMSDDVGLIYTLGSNGEAISFKESSNTRNNVADSNDDIYNSAGVSKELYNGSSSGTAVTFSVENDSAYIYAVYRQLERWVNRTIKLSKFNTKRYKFNFYLLDTTIFNRDNVSKRYKEACSLGIPVVDKWIASLDMTPSRMLGSNILHKNIFAFEDNLVHLSSSFNSSGGEAGRPTNADKGETLDTAGEKTANADSNIDR